MNVLSQFWKTRTDWNEGISDANSFACFLLKLRNLEVGELRFENDEWEFAYSEGFKYQSEICPLIGFPDVHKTYKSTALWPFFLLRVPSLSQPSVQEYIRVNKLQQPDEVALLRRFGRRSIANPFELIDCPA